MSDTPGLARYVLGCDVGGTFTDIVVTGAGRVHTLKVSSTPDDYSRAILQGVRQVQEEFGIDPGAIAAVVHATTVATNTILEHKGAKTALVTTEGFRDVLEMRRLRIPVMYDLQYDKPPPLVARRDRHEVAERLDARGQVRRPLDEAQAREIARRLAEQGVESVAVSFLHAYVDGRHERRMVQILREHLPASVYISASSQILPEIREYERTSTAVVNAYIGPIVRHYVESLAARLRDSGVRAPLQIMQSNGGTMSASATASRPACIVESGPAAGVIACAAVARAAGLDNVISFDMGPRPRPRSSKAASRRRRPSTRSGPASTSAPSWSRGAATRSSCPSSTSPRSGQAAAASSRSTSPAPSAWARAAPARCRGRRATGSAARTRPSPTQPSCSAT